MSMEQAFSMEFESESPRTRRERRLGERALFDGFMILDTARSPYEDIMETMRSRIIEQSSAIDAIIEALDRSEVRLPGDKRPIANFAFLGPTGVGKSETAKLLSELMSEDGEANLIKIDCSGYSQGHEVTSLTGSPPSYVGRDQEPILSKENVEKPGTVVLFDEIEKGSPRLYNLMLQIMGDGELRLNNGDTSNFRETIIILTSNLGAKETSALLTGNPIGFGERNHNIDRENLDSIAKKSFSEFFSPEFTNRLNKLVVFHPLSEEALGRVLDVKIEEANREYEQEFGVRISLSEATRNHIVGIAAQEPHLGARPLVRALEDNVQSAFGRHLGMAQIPEGTHVRVFHKSELSEEHPISDEQHLVFALKRDESLRKPSEIRKQIAIPTPSMLYQTSSDGTIDIKNLPPTSPFMRPPTH